METMSRLAQVIGRVALGAIFVISGLGKLTNWQGTLGYAGTKGVSAALLAIATALELLGGLSVIVGFKARWGALALVIFVVPVTLVFHNFWAAAPAEQQAQLVNFLKNLSICGGILIVLARGAGAYSIDEAKGRTSTPVATASAR
jgi:putative oxidoreductase